MAQKLCQLRKKGGAHSNAPIGLFSCLQRSTPKTGQNTVSLTPPFSGSVVVDGQYSSLTITTYSEFSVLHYDGTSTYYNLSPNQSIALTSNDYLVLLSRYSSSSNACVFTLS